MSSKIKKQIAIDIDETIDSSGDNDLCVML